MTVNRKTKPSISGRCGHSGGGAWTGEDFRFYLRGEGLPRWLSGKESTCQCRSHRFDPWLRKCPGEGNGNILAWRIPWKEGPGGLQSTRSQRVGHDMAANEQVRWSCQGMKLSDFGLLSSAGEWQRAPPWIQANQLESLSVPSWETLVA